jgi:hypothetical protein
MSFKRGIVILFPILVIGYSGCANDDDVARVKKRYGNAAIEICDERILEGDRHLTHGRYREALECYQVVLDDHPDNVPSLWGLYLACTALKRGEEARVVLDHIKELTMDTSYLPGKTSPVEAK